MKDFRIFAVFRRDSFTRHNAEGEVKCQLMSEMKETPNHYFEKRGANHEHKQ